MPSLSELREQPTPDTTVRETFTATLVTAQPLVDEFAKLQREKEDLLAQLGRPVEDEGGEETEGGKSTQRIGDSRLARLQAIRDEQSDLNEQMAAHQGELTIESRETGEWLRWCRQHPAGRNDDGDVDDTDLRLTGGQCSAEALLDDLVTYVKKWDGEPLAPGDWDKIKLVPGDYVSTSPQHLGLVPRIVNLQNRGYARVPKSQTPSSTTRSDETT